jgi:antitoxin component YwqK of YwqJK toxin-antitoxin module
MNKTVLHIICFFIIISASAQHAFSQESTFIPEAVIHKKYGIMRYEKWNMLLGGDTVRNNKGYAANGFIQDYYTTGRLLHKGFYVDGLLKIYKNYYTNGQLERNFRMVDFKKAKMDIFYKNGAPKSKIYYIDGAAQSWQDYYPNGVLEYIEVYDKSVTYYVEKANFNDDGTMINSLILENKKKLIYTQSYFHENGQIKEVGEMHYDKSMFDYIRIGTWMEFDQSGTPTKEIKYVNGEIQAEETF